MAQTEIVSITTDNKSDINWYIWLTIKSLLTKMNWNDSDGIKPNSERAPPSDKCAVLKLSISRNKYHNKLCSFFIVAADLIVIVCVCARVCMWLPLITLMVFYIMAWLACFQAYSRRCHQYHKWHQYITAEICMRSIVVRLSRWCL